MLPHYNYDSFKLLKTKLLIEGNDNLLFVNKIIANALRKKVADPSNLHEIAANYYDVENQHNNTFVSRAEYLYHLSFYKSKIQIKDDLKYYANDILSAAKELVNRGEYKTAKSHLYTISFFDNGYNMSEFCFYYALCYVFDDEMNEYRKLFDKSLALTQMPQDVIYYRMIDKLIGMRKFIEAENLLNEVREKYPPTRQMDALQIKYGYFLSKQSRKKAISDALILNREPDCDIYSAKILVKIFLAENLIDNAKSEVDSILKYIPRNEWALKMSHLIDSGFYSSETEDELEDE